MDLRLRIRHRRAFRSRPLAPIALALAAVALAGCGNGSATPTPGPSGPPAASPVASPSNPSATPPPSAQAAPGSAAATASLVAPAVPSAVAAPYPLPPVQIRLQAVTSKLDSPVAVATAGDARLFVVEQTGRIVIVLNGSVTGTFLDVSGRISCCGERGLLGLAFHPDYATNGRFFVRYTAKSGDVLISEFHRGADSNTADPGSERVLVTVPHREFPNHNGGAIRFGPDGYLYIGTGDGGGAGDPHGNGQNLGVLLGKLLRIDVNAGTGPPYGIPSGNPFAGQAGARAEIFAYGLRNPYDFSFDRATGDLWIGDVGQNLREEVDRARASEGGGRGLNFGWNVMEGEQCFSPASGCDTAGKTLPLAQYDHSAANGCAIIGGFVYRGSARPDLAGRYFFGDDCSGRIWDVSAAGPARQDPQVVLESGLQITGWGQGTDAELYVTAANGTLYRLT